eukprot:366472-Chlamydomonas_euryale.AAC.5
MHMDTCNTCGAISMMRRGFGSISSKLPTQVTPYVGKYWSRLIYDCPFHVHVPASGTGHELDHAHFGFVQTVKQLQVVAVADQCAEESQRALLVINPRSLIQA